MYFVRQVNNTVDQGDDSTALRNPIKAANDDCSDVG
jgi:hypothetical protein